MNEIYVQGFIDKCAELGVDPEALLKTAQVAGAAMIPPVTPTAPSASTGAVTKAVAPASSGFVYKPAPAGREAFWPTEAAQRVAYERTAAAAKLDVPSSTVTR